MFAILPRSRSVAPRHLNSVARVATSALAPQRATSRHVQSTPTPSTHLHFITSQRRFFSSTRIKYAPSNTSKIAVVGAGEVGSTVAYSLILNPVASEILLVDPKEEVRDAQVADLSDATYHGNTTTQIRAATHKEAGQADIIVITAGAAQKEGESRTDLIGRNLSILSSVISDMKPFNPAAILLLVANPVDVLTHFALQYSGLPRSQVFGSGTFLDSARLRGILASRAGVAASSIDAMVLGEHGESQVVAWSAASIAGIPLSQLFSEAEIDREAIAKETKDKATAIMESKGATNYGIGGVAASICKSVLFDQRNVRPVSHWQEEFGCCFSMPAVLGREGLVRTLDMELSGEEKRKLKESAESMLDVIREAEESQK